MIPGQVDICQVTHEWIKQEQYPSKVRNDIAYCESPVAEQSKI